VIGPAGRMGARVVELINAAQDLTLFSVLVRSVEQFDWSAQGIGGDCIVTDESATALNGADVMIDFTAPASCGWLAAQCAESGVAYIVASTGLSEADQRILNSAATEIPVLEAANLSYGVNVLLELVRLASQRLEGFDPEIFEIHHRYKRDAPSGTAYALGKAVEAGREGTEEVLARSGSDTLREPNQLGYGALRGGDVAGEHTVYFFGEGERIELTHRSSTPSIFAAGSLKAARWIVTQPAGRYTMQDVIKG